MRNIYIRCVWTADESALGLKSPVIPGSVGDWKVTTWLRICRHTSVPMCRLTDILNGTSTHLCVGTFSKRHRHGTNGQTDGQSVTRKRPSRSANNLYIFSLYKSPIYETNLQLGFLLRDAMQYVRPSVRPSVCLSHRHCVKTAKQVLRVLHIR